jgi:hypothetical protein
VVVGVIRVRLPPVVAFITQIWDVPDRSLSNAIFEPSGDQVGAPVCA